MNTIQDKLAISHVKRNDIHSRCFLFTASLMYAASLLYCLSSYAANKWLMFGFSYGQITYQDVLILSFSILIWSMSVPTRIDRPSSLLLITVYIFLCIPAAVIAVGLDRASEVEYYPLLTTLTVGFALSSVFAKSNAWLGSSSLINPNFVRILLVTWISLLLILIYSFSSVMNFVNIDDIYTQRSKGAPSNLFEGYAQTYFGYVISPAILACGLYLRRYSMIVVGFLGSIILYMITAEKAVFMYPFFITVFFILLSARLQWLRTTGFLCFFLCLLLCISTFFHEYSLLADFLAWYVGVRSFLLPGATVIYYYDFFAEHGYTFLSHVTGFNQLIDTPKNYLLDLRWPSLGLIVGEDYLNMPTMNANANFIASDGIASMGLIGVYFSFAMFAVFLKLLDKSANGINILLTLPMLLPIALTLTNGSLFTTLTSYGGIFLMFSFRFLVTKDYVKYSFFKI